MHYNVGYTLPTGIVQKASESLLLNMEITPSLLFCAVSEYVKPNDILKLFAKGIKITPFEYSISGR